MKIISFYSYKGGTGRTTTMANVAVMLVQKGRSVACLDLDITAPGLDIAMEIDKIPQRTIREFFMSFNVTVEETYVDWCKTIRIPFPGNLYIFPMPRVGTNKLIAKVTPGMCDNLENLLREIENELKVDYVLLDTRSGFADESAIVFLVSHKIFVSSRFTYQHLVGLDCILEILDKVKKVKRKENRELEYYVILNDIPRDLPPSHETAMRELRDHRQAILIRENRIMRWMDKVVVSGYSPEESIYNKEMEELQEGYQEIIQKIEE